MNKIAVYRSVHDVRKSCARNNNLRYWIKSQVFVEQETFFTQEQMEVISSYIYDEDFLEENVASWQYSGLYGIGSYMEGIIDVDSRDIIKRLNLDLEIADSIEGLVDVLSIEENKRNLNFVKYRKELVKKEQVLYETQNRTFRHYISLCFYVPSYASLLEKLSNQDKNVWYRKDRICDLVSFDSFGKEQINLFVDKLNIGLIEPNQRYHVRILSLMGEYERNLLLTKVLNDFASTLIFNEELKFSFPTKTCSSDFFCGRAYDQVLYNHITDNGKLKGVLELDLYPLDIALLFKEKELYEKLRNMGFIESEFEDVLDNWKKKISRGLI